MIIKIKEILRNKELKNGLWLYLLQIFNTVVPLITLPYITRVLGKTEYGTFAIATNIIGYLQVLVEYGFGMSATRDVVLCRNDNDKINELFINVIFSRFVLYILSLFIAFIYVYIKRDDTTLVSCTICLMLCLFGYVLQQNWLFQGRQDMKYISIINIIARCISTILIFCLVKNQNDIFLYTLLYSFSPFLSGILGFFVAKRKYKLCITFPKISGIKTELMRGFYVFTTSLSAKVFGSIGVTFLGIIASKDVVGIFSVIQKIPNMLMLIWAPISQVLYPISSRHMMDSFEEGLVFVNKARRTILPFFIILSVFISIFSNFIVGFLFGFEYKEKAYWIIPLLIWMLLGINNNFLGSQILLASGNDKFYSKCFQIGVICTVVINAILIYFFSGIGASFAPMLSELILFILLSKQVRKIKHRY